MKTHNVHLKEHILYGITGIIIGMILTWIFTASMMNRQNKYLSHHIQPDTVAPLRQALPPQNMASMMSGMVDELSGKTGEEFDREFIAQMIIHHQGAIDMANAALVNAKHPELKALSKSIISAQAKEIAQMKTWQKTWFK